MGILVATETIYVIRRLEFFVSTSQPLGRERAGDGVQSSVANALINHTYGTSIKTLNSGVLGASVLVNTLSTRM